MCETQQSGIKEKASSIIELRQDKYSFEELLLEAIDQELSLLGNAARQAIYYYLKEDLKIEKRDIPNKIEEFTNAIEDIFGEGAKLLEIQIMKRIYERLGGTIAYPMGKKDLVFSEYVTAVKSSGSS